MIPKFRAWDKEEKEMLAVHGINFDAKGLWTKEAIDEEDDGGFIFFDDIILMQSTGLKDKNGKEIYEGDIVEVIISDTEPKIHEDKEVLGKIVYKCGSFDVAIEDDKFAGIIPMMHLGDCEFTFIIHGNIFQNPHLLEADSHDR